MLTGLVGTVKGGQSRAVAELPEEGPREVLSSRRDTVGLPVGERERTRCRRLRRVPTAQGDGLPR